MAKPKYKSRAKRASEQAEHFTNKAGDLQDLIDNTPFDVDELTEEQESELVEQANAIIGEVDFAELESLTEEIQSWRDGMQGTNLENTEKYSTLDETASTLENIEPSIDEVSDFSDIEQRISDLEDKASELESVEFPGMFS